MDVYARGKRGAVDYLKLPVNSVRLFVKITDSVLSSMSLHMGFKQEAQLMLTTGSTRLAVSRGQQTWYHFRSIATFR